MESTISARSCASLWASSERCLMGFVRASAYSTRKNKQEKENICMTNITLVKITNTQWVQLSASVFLVYLRKTHKTNCGYHHVNHSKSKSDSFIPYTRGDLLQLINTAIAHQHLLKGSTFFFTCVVTDSSPTLVLIGDVVLGFGVHEEWGQHERLVQLILQTDVVIAYNTSHTDEMNQVIF